MNGSGFRDGYKLGLYLADFLMEVAPADLATWAAEVRATIDPRPRCVRGHVKHPENVYLLAGNRRQCKECHRATARESRRRKQEQAA